MRQRGSLRNEAQLQVVDDAVHQGVVGEESDDAHLAAALRALRFIMHHLAYLLAEKR